MGRMPHRDVAGGVEHALIDQDAARRRQILQRGAIDQPAGLTHDSGSASTSTKASVAFLSVRLLQA